MKKIACVIVVAFLAVSLVASVFAASRLISDEGFVKYLRQTLFKGVKISSIVLVPTNNSKVVAAIVKVGAGYDEMTYLYVYSRALSGRSTTPTQIFQKRCDSTHPLLSCKFDDTGNIFIVRQGTMYANPHSSTVSIYGANRGNLITSIDVPSWDENAVKIVDNPGQRITISTYVTKTMGTQIVLKATASGATIVSKNDHYLPADILKSLSATASNKDTLIYVTASGPYTFSKETYNFFAKDGTYRMSATKYSCISSYGGGCTSSIGSPDASADGKYVAIAYNHQQYSTGVKPEQYMTVFDAKTGSFVDHIALLSPDQDTVTSIKFVKGSSDRIAVNYEKAGRKVYGISPEKQDANAAQLNEIIQKAEALSAQNQNIKTDPNMAGNSSVASQLIKK